MTEELILDRIHKAEGDALKNDPADPQDPSKFGIGAETLGNWRGYRRRATLPEMAGLRWPEAEQIYRVRFIDQPGFTPQNIPCEEWRLQMIDFGVNSGPERAIRYLQKLIGVSQDGKIGPITRVELQDALDLDPMVGKWLNDALLGWRLALIDHLTDTRKGYKAYEEGLETRALNFLARYND